MTTSFVALLRAVNVGGTGKLPMSDLKQLCEKVGLGNVRTYIASGNVIFQNEKSEAQIKAALEVALHDYAGKPVGVLVRTAAEMAAILSANPFTKLAPNRTLVTFLDEPPANDTLARIVGRKNEQIELGAREIYIHYTDGIADSKLRIPTAGAGTSRNMNTVAKLVELASSMQSL